MVQGEPRPSGGLGRHPADAFGPAIRRRVSRATPEQRRGCKPEVYRLGAGEILIAPAINGLPHLNGIATAAAGSVLRRFNSAVGKESLATTARP